MFYFLSTLLLWIVTENLFADIMITNTQALKDFRDAVNGGTTYVGQNIYLEVDLDLNEEAWTPIGTEEHPFKGNFEGWGHKITHLNITGSNDYAGLFGHIDGGSVRDVGIEGTSICGGTYVGGICGYLKLGEISSCYSNIAVSGAQYVGGLCGYSTGKMENCWHEGNVTASAASEANAGGLVGHAKDATLQRCYVISTTVKVTSANINSFFGYIAGQWDGTVDDHLECCRYETETVSVEGFTLGGDVIIGSASGEDSPSAMTVKGASTDEMTNQAYWTGILNTEVNNLVWVIESGSYPQLNSFCKNQDITFHFTPEKKWLSIVPNGNYTDLKGIKAYIVTSADKASNTITLHQVSTLNEGCGALVYYETEEYEGEDITLSHTTDAGLADYSSNLLQGSHVSPIGFVGDGTEYILKSGTFVPANSGSLARNKAYLKVPSEAMGSIRYDFQLEDETITGIKSVGHTTDAIDEEDGWYTLNGRKLNGKPTEKGVFLYHGHKILIP